MGSGAAPFVYILQSAAKCHLTNGPDTGKMLPRAISAHAVGM